MEEVNYNDKVILPYLEKKCKDLLSVNMILEAKLLVEQNKVKDFENFVNAETEKTEGQINQIENLKSNIDLLNTTISRLQQEKNDIEGQRNQFQSQCQREESLKNNAISEYHMLNSKYGEIQSQNESLKLHIDELKKQLEFKLNEPKTRKTKTEIAI